MTTTKTKPTPKGAQLADDLADLFPLVPDSDRWGSYFNQSDEPGDDSIDAWQQREARFLALVNAAPELLEELRNCVRHNADILDNCLFPAHGLKANLTPEQALWREKIKKWNTGTRAAIAKATGQN